MADVTSPAPEGGTSAPDGDRFAMADAPGGGPAKGLPTLLDADPADVQEQRTGVGGDGSEW
jgi:hypothetical protein